MRIVVDMLIVEQGQDEAQRCLLPHETQYPLTGRDSVSPGEGNEYPSVSVIIPASRHEQLKNALETLSRQDYQGQIEIIVVGPPASQLTLRRPLRLIHPEAIYAPGKARNLGAAQARGDILLFLDDDMLVAANWMTQNVEALRQEQIGAVGARMPGKSSGFYARCADFTNYGHYQHRRAMDDVLGAGSIGIKKTVFVAVGGFDERLRAGEDIELCRRLQKQGYRTLYQPEIVVVHDHRYDSLSKLLLYNYRHGLHGAPALRLRMQREDLIRSLSLRIIQWPPLFLCVLPLLALLGMGRIVGLNLADHRRVLLYTPCIFLGKLAYQFGIFVYLIKGKKRL